MRATDYLIRPTRISSSQHRMDSIMETATNTAIGFVLALITWHIVAWAYGIPMPIGQNLQITAWFTLVSLGRQYLLRRAFNGRTVWASIRAWWVA